MTSFDFASEGARFVEIMLGAVSVWVCLPIMFQWLDRRQRRGGRATSGSRRGRPRHEWTTRVNAPPGTAIIYSNVRPGGSVSASLRARHASEPIAEGVREQEQSTVTPEAIVAAAEAAGLRGAADVARWSEYNRRFNALLYGSKEDTR